MATSQILRLLPLFLSSSLLVAACGGSTSQVGNGNGDGDGDGDGDRDEAPCEQGETMDDGCNTCTCEAGGWSCTLIACEPFCKEGESKDAEDGCNTCSCAGGQWACTKRACAPLCEEGDTKEADDGCNTCSCVDGTWACTEKACEGKLCGGFAGATCDDTEYCAYEEGQLCGAADASANCKPRPTVCNLLEDPVCGCDGKDYSNACAAASAGTGVMKKGLCD